MSLHRPFLLGLPLAAVLLLPGCYHRQLSPEEQKGVILATAQDYYLWNDQLPVIRNVADYGDPASFLDVLTAQPRAEGLDRGFSYLLEAQVADSLFELGQEMGYGFQGRMDAEGYLVLDVFPGAASKAGFVRGDTLIAVAPDEAGLELPANQVTALVAADAFNQALLSATAGTTRFFRLKSRLDGTLRDVSATTSAYDLDSVPHAAAPVILDAGGGHKVGYLRLRIFIEPSQDLLREAVGLLRTAGCTDLVVDLRYNGGGRVDTAIIFLNLIHPVSGAPRQMFSTHCAPTRSQDEWQVSFSPEAQAMLPGKLAFIVTGATASASELMVNVLQPYLGTDLALVGSRTLGKPVGQTEFYIDDSLDLLLVTFQSFNANGVSDYFTGLPDAHFQGVSEAAEDDPGHALGDPAEASLAAALQWIADGSRPGGDIPQPAAAGRARMGQETQGSLVHPRTSPLKTMLPGLH